MNGKYSYVMKCLTALFCASFEFAHYARGRDIASPLAPSADYPFHFSVPRCTTPPRIDGKISAGEWARASVITGVAGAGGAPLDRKQPRVYLCYDGNRIYWAFRVPVLPGERLSMKVRTRKGPTWWDESVETYFHPMVKHTGYFPTYQIIVNPYGAIYDIERLRQIGQAVHGWNPDWQLKTGIVKDQEWVLEASLPFKDMHVAAVRPDLLWLSRFCIKGWSNWQSGLPGYGAWTDEAAMAFMRFQGEEPILQLTSGMAAMVDGKIALSGRVINPTTDAATVEIEVALFRGHRKVDSERSGPDPVQVVRHKIEVPAGQTLAFRLDEAFADELGPKAVAIVKAVWREGQKTLFESESNVTTGLPLPEPKTTGGAESALPLNVRYAPGVNRVWVNVDRFEFPAKENLHQIDIKVLDPKKKRLLATAVISSFRHDYGDAVLDLPALADGKHTVEVKAADAAGTVVAQAEATFEKRSYEWLGTGVGKSREVHPPFEPLRVNGQQVSLWNRTVALDGAGFPSGIVNGGIDQLAGPAALVCELPGSAMPLSAAEELRFIEKSPDVVRFEGEAANHRLRVATSGRVEIDGMLLYTVTLIPLNGPTQVDQLALDLPLAESESLFYITVGDSFRSNWRGARVPQGKGVVWDTTDISNASILGHFVPYVGLCNDERGFMWFADSPRGFAVPDNQPYISLIRKPGQMVLRVHLVSHAVLAGPRTLTFGLIPTPVKPLPKCHRAFDFFGNPEGLAANYRWDFEGMELARFENRAFTWAQPPDTWDKDKASGAIRRWTESDNVVWLGDPEKKRPAARQPATTYYVPYISGNFPASGSAWLGNSEDFFYEWRSPEPFWEGAFVESYRDFYTYYLQQWIRRDRLRAFYVDNCYPCYDANLLTGRGYARDDGKRQGGYDMLDKRRFYRRLANTMLANTGTSFIALHKTNTMPIYGYTWADVAMDGEDEQGDNKTRFFNDHYNLDRMRSIVRTQQWGLVPYFLIPKGTEAEGSLLAHDVRWFTWSNNPLLKHAFGLLDLSAADLEFIGYWTLQKNAAVRTGSPDVLVSAYTRPHNRALLVILNIGDRDHHAPTTLDLEAIGFKEGFVKAMRLDEYDPEEQPYRTPIPLEGRTLTVPVKAHDYRLVCFYAH